MGGVRTVAACDTIWILTLTGIDRSPVGTIDGRVVRVVRTSVKQRHDRHGLSVELAEKMAVRDSVVGTTHAIATSFYPLSLHHRHSGSRSRIHSISEMMLP